MIINPNFKFQSIRGDDLATFMMRAVARALNPSIVIDENIERICKWYRRGSLTLVFGAGASMECGLPSWEALLSKYMAFCYKNDEYKYTLATDVFKEIFQTNSLILARMLNIKSNTDVISSLREILYEKEKLEDGKIYESSAFLCKERDTIKRINAVITYNYDDILERMIKRCSGKRTVHKPIHGKLNQSYRNLLPIYHVHGFIPKEKSNDEDEIIVFSEDSYHSQYSDIYNWNNTIQIEKFRDTNCLFVGTSFSDPNMRRLLDISVRQKSNSTCQHFMIKKRHDYRDIINKFRFDFELISESTTENDVITALIEMAEELEEDDARSFGIDIIWVDSYSEIHKLIKRIS